MHNPVPVLLLLALAAACASPGDRRAEAPKLVVDSQRPAEITAACIAEAWDETSWRPVDQRHAGERHSILATVPSMANIAFMADVEPAGSGSRVTFYSVSSYWARDTIRNAVQDCAAQAP